MKEKILDLYAKNKKVVWIVGAVLVVIIALVLVGGSKQDKFSDILLKDYIPEIKKGKLEIVSNNNDSLSLHVKKVPKTFFNEYKNECIKKGFDIDSTEDGNEYEAFNKEGYKLRISTYSDGQTNIYLDAPEKLGEITWPTSGLATLIPTPESTLGKIITDSSEYFHIQLGKTSKDEYKKYVSSCEDKGFTVDYDKDENSFSAKNKDSYKISVKYLGNDNIDIYLEAPKKEDDSETTPSNPSSSDNTETDNNTQTNNDSNMVDGMRKEFKDAMDSYEEFMDEYVSFMKKYNANPTDTGLLADYTKYLSKYSKFVEDFDKWDGNDLNAKEAAYYLKVQTRVNKKLLDVAN